MKRNFKVLAAFGLAAAMMISSAVPSLAIGGPISANKTETKEEVKYEFKSGETVISMGAEAAGILTALGKASSTFERDSCAYQGKNKVYTYKGFELCTYPVNKKDCVESVYIFDAAVSTPEGIKIGSTKKEVLAAYGNAYNADEAKFGTYAYTAGNTQLKIYTTKDVVDAIEYIVIPEK